MVDRSQSASERHPDPFWPVPERRPRSFLPSSSLVTLPPPPDHTLPSGVWSSALCCGFFPLLRATPRSALPRRRLGVSSAPLLLPPLCGPSHGAPPPPARHRHLRTPARPLVAPPAPVAAPKGSLGSFSPSLLLPHVCRPDPGLPLPTPGRCVGGPGRQHPFLSSPFHVSLLGDESVSIFHCVPSPTGSQTSGSFRAHGGWRGWRRAAGRGGSCAAGRPPDSSRGGGGARPWAAAQQGSGSGSSGGLFGSNYK